MNFSAKSLDELLDEALEETFPASDPIAITVEPETVEERSSGQRIQRIGTRRLCFAIADDVPAKFEIEFDLYVFGVVKENLPTGAIGHVVHAVARLASVVLLHRLKGCGCQMQLPRAGGKFWPRPPLVLGLSAIVLPSFANELR
jgi:hypothetical protein